ncbi:hypothetical protein BgiBS90_032459 [Biomphalaria glabrata]|nr:hypothetical protein BgiBS90_032459 [Biomphalaria glabrata]
MMPVMWKAYRLKSIVSTRTITSSRDVCGGWLVAYASEGTTGREVIVELILKQIIVINHNIDICVIMNGNAVILENFALETLDKGT